MNWMLFFSIVLFYLILVVINIPASFLGIEFESDTKPRRWYQPSGFVISIIWFILFTLLGIARYILIVDENGEKAWWLISLAVLFASYAYYTLGLAKITGISALWLGLIGNIVVIAFATLVVYNLLMVSQTAAMLVIPVIIWMAYASLIVIGEMKLDGLL